MEGLKKTLIVLGAIVGVAAVAFIGISIYTVFIDNVGTA
jgi:hypothetical protein